MGIEKVLTALGDSVRARGNGKWTAKCPAHDDRTPSLSISVDPNGTVGVKCWVGCTFEAIADSLSLKASDFFADKIKAPFTFGAKMDYFTGEAIKALYDEILFIHIACNDIVSGRGIKKSDLARTEKAMGRLNVIYEYLGLTHKISDKNIYQRVEERLEWLKKNRRN